MPKQIAVEDDLSRAAAQFARLDQKNASPEGDDVEEVQEVSSAGADPGDAETESKDADRKSASGDEGEAKGEVDPKATSASEPPPSLSDEEKAAWSALPPEAKAFLKGYAERREGDVARHLNAKSGELAETNRQIKARGEAALAEFGKRIESLDATIHGVRALIGQEPDWVALARDLDPNEFNQRQAAWNQVQAKLNAAEGERAKIAKEAEGKLAERRQAALEFHRGKLIEEFKSPEGIDKAWDAIDPYLASEGFSEAERGQMYDSRMWKTAYKAAQWDKLQREKKNVHKDAKPAPKLTKPGAASQPGDRDQARLGAAMSRLKKSGSTVDAAAAFEARFGK